MRLAQILTLLTSEPLLCTNDYRAALLELFQQHAGLERGEFRHKRTGTDYSGSKVDIRGMELDEHGIAHIPVAGPIGMGLGEFEKGAGAVDVDDIRAELQEADIDPDVRAIILDFDTPGGMVAGTPELAQRIQAVDKPIWAFSRGLMASAGYWLGSACDGIMVTPSADVGSIGVYAPFADYTRAAEMAGVKVKVFTSGKYKGAGVPGTSLSAEQETFMQNRVMEIAEMFYQHVRDMRGEIADEDMQGQVFKGQPALARGLVDQVVNSKDDLVSFLS